MRQLAIGRGVGKLLVRCGSDAQRRRLAEYALRHVTPQERRASLLGLLVDEGTWGVHVERDGLLWNLDVRDEIGQQVFVDGRYQGSEIDAMLAWLAERRIAHDRDLVVDVGANIGTTTLVFANAGYRAVAIEPVPATFELLHDNVVRNGFTERVICLQRAITEDGPMVEMWTAPGTAQSEVRVPGRDPGFGQWGATADGVVAVAAGGLTETLGAAGVDQSSVALVWCDTQGCEASVIRTGAALWRRGIPLYLEVWPAGLALHGGVDGFVAEAELHFSGFVSRDSLLRSPRVEPRPIREFGPFVRGPHEIHYTDALLVP